MMALRTLQQDTSHVFNLPGLYNVTLTTLNATHDISQSERKQISVTGLYANFTADKLIGYQNTTGENIRVNFTSNQTDVFGATYYHWDFGMVAVLYNRMHMQYIISQVHTS
jgi:PKD repeat protein